MVLGYRLNETVRLLPGGAAYIPESSTLLVADLHLGCEATLEYDGLSVPRLQTKRIRDYLMGLVDEFDVAEVIVAGDLKHNFSRNLIQEWQDVSSFVADLSSRVSLQVVKGNHDNYLGQILKDFSIPLVKETEVSGMRVLHGHQGSLDGRPTVIGHMHPSLVLRDSTGASVKENCHLYNEDRRVLVLPALSILAGGADVVRHSVSDSSSPIVSDAGIDDFFPLVFTGNKALKFPSIGKIRDMEGF